MTKFTMCQVSPRRGLWAAGLQCQACTLETVPRESHQCQLLRVLEVLGGCGELSHASVAPASRPLTERRGHGVRACGAGRGLTQCTQPAWLSDSLVPPSSVGGPVLAAQEAARRGLGLTYRALRDKSRFISTNTLLQVCLESPSSFLVLPFLLPGLLPASILLQGPCSQSY